MSTIKVDNIRIASESVSRPATGVAAVWGVTANDATVLDGQSYGVTTTVNEEDGKTTVNFAAAFSTPTYPFVVTSQSSNARCQTLNAQTTLSIVMHNKTCDNVYAASIMRFQSGGELA